MIRLTTKLTSSTSLYVSAVELYHSQLINVRYSILIYTRIGFLPVPISVWNDIEIIGSIKAWYYIEVPIIAFELKCYCFFVSMNIGFLVVIQTLQIILILSITFLEFSVPSSNSNSLSTGASVGIVIAISLLLM